jgi:predicted ATP-dependent protease
VTGTQGVLISAANPSSLMLRSDVVEAAAVGRFSIWVARSVDEAIELLTGVPAGMELPDGGWLDASVNGLVARRLAELAEHARSFRTEA